MTAIELPTSLVEVATKEAQRRGVGIAEVVEEAVRRYVAAPALRGLLDDFAADDAERADRLSDDEAMQVALEEQAAARAEHKPTA